MHTHTGTQVLQAAVRSNVPAAAMLAGMSRLMLIRRSMASCVLVFCYTDASSTAWKACADGVLSMQAALPQRSRSAWALASEYIFGL